MIYIDFNLFEVFCSNTINTSLKWNITIVNQHGHSAVYTMTNTQQANHMLLFAMIRSVVKLVKVPVVEVAELANRFLHRSSGDKSAGYVCIPAVEGSVLIVAVRE